MPLRATSSWTPSITVHANGEVLFSVIFAPCAGRFAVEGTFSSNTVLELRPPTIVFNLSVAFRNLHAILATIVDKNGSFGWDRIAFRKCDQRLVLGFLVSFVWLRFRFCRSIRGFPFYFYFFYFLVTNNDRSVELFVINGDATGFVVVVNFCGYDDVRILVLVISSGPNEVVATHLVPTLR